PPERVLFFVELIKPHQGLYKGVMRSFPPDDHRCGPLHARRQQPSFIFIREGRQLAIESFYFYIIFLYVPATVEVYDKVRADFADWFGRLTPDVKSIKLRPDRDYFDLKKDEYGLNRHAYYRWRNKYLSDGGDEIE